VHKLPGAFLSHGAWPCLSVLQPSCWCLQNILPDYLPWVKWMAAKFPTPAQNEGMAARRWDEHAALGALYKNVIADPAHSDGPGTTKGRKRCGRFRLYAALLPIFG
jgi:hypothetical protein